MRRGLFTSESVAAGHPDKLCDRVSDAVLDACLSVNPKARVAVEALATKNLLVVAGEFSLGKDKGEDSCGKKLAGYGGRIFCRADFEESALEQTIQIIARKVVREIGYSDAMAQRNAFHCDAIDIVVKLQPQSPDIRKAVGAINAKVEAEGAGDQGLMFGYACDETEQRMPLAITVAHALMQGLAQARASGAVQGLGPDAKAQVTVCYDDKGMPQAIDTVVISTLHDESLSLDEVRALVKPVVKQVLTEMGHAMPPHLYVNPSKRFVYGGPSVDVGLTGRKIIVDTYGGAAPHGGGAFSGKDPTKVDRSGAYAARHLARNVVAAGLARRCLIQVAYAIGRAEPVSLTMDLDGSAQAGLRAGLQEKLEAFIQHHAGAGGDIDMTPAGLRKRLALTKPIYERCAAYGHFGRAPEADGGFSWEREDLTEMLRAEFS